MAWRVGERVAGFELEGVLGRGGMGVVYRARHLESGKRVALKTLPLDASLEARAAPDAPFFSSVATSEEAPPRLTLRTLVAPFVGRFKPPF